MNPQKTSLVAGLLLLWFGAPQLSQAQDTVERAWNSTDGRTSLSPSRPGAVHSWNRASHVVGTRARNIQDEDLGRIEDVVLDFQTGRIAYVVIAVPSQAGDRLVAVPASALLPASDYSHLVLNTDRSRLERAPSFARDNWPDVDRPLPGTEVFGATGTDRDRTYSSSRPEADRDRTVVEIYPQDQTVISSSDQGLAPHYEGSSRTEQYQAPAATAVRRSSFRGRIVAVNPETRMLSVEANSGEIRDFLIGDRPNIQLKNNRNPRIVDLKVGFPIVVGYREQSDGTSVAQTIIRTDAPEVR